MQSLLLSSLQNLAVAKAFGGSETIKANIALMSYEAADAMLAEREKSLSAGHGAQGEPATVREEAHETPGRQSIPEGGAS